MPIRLVMLPLVFLICNKQSAGHTTEYVFFSHETIHEKEMEITVVLHLSMVPPSQPWLHVVMRTGFENKILHLDARIGQLNTLKKAN